MNAFEYNMWEEGEDGNWYETDETVISIWSEGSTITIEGASLADFTENNFIFE
jgi:hypothetical protein